MPWSFAGQLGRRAQCDVRSSNVYKLRYICSSSTARSRYERPYRMTVHIPLRDTIVSMPATECNSCKTPWTYLVIQAKHSARPRRRRMQMLIIDGLVTIGLNGLQAPGNDCWRTCISLYLERGIAYLSRVNSVTLSH